MNCGHCGITIPDGRKYCSRSCAVTVNNRGVVRNFVNGQHAKKQCENCGIETLNGRFCSIDCRKQGLWNARHKKIIDNQQLFWYQHDKQHLIAIRGHQCEMCKNTMWNDEPIALILDHIDGNSDNNLLVNVRLLCPNCNATTPTFCGKNKGNGRSARKQYRNDRYKQGLSY